MYHKKIILLLLLSFFIFSACQNDDEPEQEQVTPTTFVKEETEIVAVSDNTITLTGNQTEIETSDIIVSGANGNAPNGFLRKVVSISSSNGNTIFQTQRTSISEAVKYYFEDGEEHQDNFSYTFSDSDIEGRSSSVTNTTPISIDIDETITTNQGGITLELNITGNITITPSIVGDIKLSRHNLSPVFEEFVFSISTENEFNISLNSELSLAFDTGDIQLGRFEGPPITLFVGIPVVIRPQFTLYIGANGDLTANILYTYNNNSTAIAGVTYDDGWQYLPNNGFSINSQGSTATASVSGNIKAYVKPEFSLALYDNSIVSAGISVEPYARFEGAISSTEYSWAINGGIDTGAYFKAFDFGFISLVDETWENLIEIPEWEIASGFYNIATITNPIPTDNSTITEQPINFSWQPNDFTISPTYEILFGTDINSLTSIGTTNNTNFTYSNILNDGTYYWKIVANDESGNYVTESLFFSFTLDSGSTSVSPAHTPNPANNTTDIAVNGNLSFSVGENTPADATYKLYFDTTSSPTTVFTLTSGVTTHTYSNIQNGTTYYWKVETISSSNSVLATSPIWNFTTISNASIPTITTTALTDITQTTATSGGNVTDEGGSNVTAKGIVWSTTQNPTISDNITNDGTGTGSFTSSLNSLTENTTYYVRAYATNSIGTAYGNEVEFSTLSNSSIPTITTTAITNITQTTAISGGDVTDNGGSNVIAKGVVWSTSQNPTISDNITNDGTGTGSFTSSLSSLTENTTYYVRAYATNSVGTAYGTEMQFTTQNGNSGNIYEGDYLIINQQDIDDFNNQGYTEITGDLDIILSSNIINLLGLENLLSVGGNVYIQDNTSLNSLAGLDNIETIGGFLYISDNNLLNSIASFNNLNSIGSYLQIRQNQSLSQVNSFNSLTTIGGYFLIYFNSSLLDINGYNNLTNISGDIVIGNNNALTNLNGLSTLIQLGGNIHIGLSSTGASMGNGSLLDFCGLTNLLTNGSFNGSYNVNYNAYNPTQQDIIDGNCSQ